MPGENTRGKFTGRHMAIIMIAGFGLVIAVNIAMASLAIGGFQGVVVENSYVASQKFNGWLEEARAQDRLGWATLVVLNAARHVSVTVPGPGFAITGTAHHPLGRAPDVALQFKADASGRLVATTPLPAGRWQVRLTIRRGAETKRLAQVLA